LLEQLPSEAFRAWGHQLQFKDLVEYYLRKYELKLAVHYPALHLHRPFENDVMHRMNRAVVERLSNHGIDVLTGAMDLHSYLPEDILAKVDRATMSVGLEGRVPILDHNVVQLAAGIPVQFKTQGGQPKYLLKKLLSAYVPKELWERPKKGFGIPISRWLRTSLKEWAHDELFAGNEALYEWLDRGELQRVFEDHQSGRRDNKNLIWAALQLAGWHRRVARLRSATGAIG
jgi:asparagine synthetase B (glutamine-hydrolysing)